jgi:hypothetical protein
MAFHRSAERVMPSPPPPPQLASRDANYHPPVSHFQLSHMHPQSPFHPALLSVHDPQAQFMLAQAMHNIQYLMGMAPNTSGTHRHPVASVVPFPTSAPPPFLPLPNQRYPSQNIHSYEDFDGRNCRDPGASGSSYHDRVPSSLPPSSPPPSSPRSSPRRRSALCRGRSRSRGRRVSFHAEEEHIYDISNRSIFEDEAEVRRSRSTPHAPLRLDALPSSLIRSRSQTRHRSASPAVDSELPDDLPLQRGRGGARDRGQTPGPPKRR